MRLLDLEVLSDDSQIKPKEVILCHTCFEVVSHPNENDLEPQFCDNCIPF